MSQIPDLFDLKLILPELTMAVMAMLALMFGVFDKLRAFRTVGAIAILSFAIVAYLVFMLDQDLLSLRNVYSATAFNNLIRIDPFAATMKYMIILGGLIACIFGWRFFERTGNAPFEYFPLVMLCTVGMMIMVSSNNFLTLYVGLELQSLALYVLASFDRDNARSSESGLKYFVLGALASGLLLFGISYIYGFSGSLNFMQISTVIGGAKIGENLGLVTGVVMVLAGLAFKVSAVPFHMWTPDVYEGAPTPVTAFFAIAPKIAALALFVRVLSVPIGSNAELWQQVVVFLSAASMVVGAVAALRQSSIKRLMAYSSIGHMGFVLMGLAAVTQEGVQSLVMYMMIYLVMSVGAFACILSMRRRGQCVEAIDDLSGLSKTNPLMAMCLLVIFFSMAGIPPLAGFFAKFYVIIAALGSGLYFLAVLGVLASVISAYYYLNIVKIMYFDEPKESLDRFQDWEMSFLMLVSAVILLCFVLYPDPVMAWSTRSASLIYADH